MTTLDLFADGVDGASDDAPLIDPAWIDAVGASALLPASLAAWQPLVTAGLAWFLNHLPAARREALLQAQFELPLTATPDDRLAVLLRTSPILHKLGQVVARQPHLSAPLRERLAQLESMAPQIDARTLADLHRRLKALPGAPALRIGRQALAEGSVAWVLAFSWKEPGAPEGVCEGVFKVLKSHVVEHLDEELALLDEAARYLEQQGRALGLPPLDYAGTLDGIGRRLAEEIRLDREQEHLRHAMQQHAGDPHIRIPELLPWSAPWVTAMRRIRGQALADAQLSPQRRRELAEQAIDALLARPFWSGDAQSVFHGDLHGGNLMLAEDGRLAVLDWAMVAPMTLAQRDAVLRAVVAATLMDARALVQALAQLGGSGGETTSISPALQQAVDEALDDLARRPQPVDFAWLLSLLDRLALQGVLAVDADLALFRKSWLSLTGVLNDLGGGQAPDLVLARAALLRHQSWWLQRLGLPAPDGDRGKPPGRLGEAPWLSLLAGAGWAGWRWWMRASGLGDVRTGGISPTPIGLRPPGTLPRDNAPPPRPATA